MASARRSNRKASIKPKAETVDVVSIPNHFRCPITLELMIDPVTVSTGITYDRQSIETWLDMGNSTCPVTNQDLVVDDLIPNHSLRRLIQDWCVENTSLGIERIPTPKIPITTAQACHILSEIDNINNNNNIGGIDNNWARAVELAARVGRLADESERNRRSFTEAGAARVLAALFRGISGCDSLDIGVLEEILSTMTRFQPFDYESCVILGSNKSLLSIALILKHGDLAARLNAVVIVNEVLSSGGKDVAAAASGTSGLLEGLIGLIRESISPRATKASLATILILLNSSNEARTAGRLVELSLVPLILDVLVDCSADKGACEKALAVLDAAAGFETGRDAACAHALVLPLLVKKMFRVSDVGTELVVSALWKLCRSYNGGGENGNGVILAEAIQVGAFQKVLLLLQVGCSGRAKEKATELLKMMNGCKHKLECVDVIDFRGLKRSS